MNPEEYKNELGIKKNKLKSALARNLAIATIGLATSFSMLEYKKAEIIKLSEQMGREFLLTEKTLKEKYIPKLDRLRTINKTARGIEGASGAYLLLGCGIPIFNYIRKKKYLEEDII